MHRRDPLIRFFATLVRAIFWFHPLVWIAHRQLVATQEQACDQFALHSMRTLCAHAFLPLAVS